MQLKKPTVTLALPFGLGSIDLEVDESQQRAAWEIYIELTTRIAIQPLDDKHGLLREALTSLYSMFGITREILRRAGPGAAKAGLEQDTLGTIAIRVLNDGIRPFNAKWHPLLADYEKIRPAEIGAYEHEQKWEQAAKMRQELDILQRRLEDYAIALAKIAGVKHTHIDRPDPKGKGKAK